MPLTLSELRTKLRNELFTDPNGRIWKDENCDDYLQDAYMQVISDGQFGWPGIERGSYVLTCVGGTREYNLPSDFGRMRLIMSATLPLLPMDFEDVMVLDPLGVQALPTNYYLENDIIGFYPIPPSAISVTMWYQKIPPVLTENEEMVLKDDFVPAIVKYAAYLAWSAPRGNTETAQNKLIDYKRALSRLMNTYQWRDNSAINYRVQRRRTYQNYPTRLNNDA